MMTEWNMKFNQTHFVVNVTLFVKKDSRFRVIPDSMLSQCFLSLKILWNFSMFFSGLLECL